MRTKNEKRLLVVLLIILLVGGNFYGYRWLSQKQSSLTLTEKQLRADKAEAEVGLQKQDLWAKRKAWIAKHEPALEGEEESAKAKVLETVHEGVVAQNLEILEQSLNETQHTSAGTRVNVSIKIKGSMEGICNWLTDLQKPENFYAVSLFSLKADQDQKSMICTLHLARYFKGGS